MRDHRPSSQPVRLCGGRQLGNSASVTDDARPLRTGDYRPLKRPMFRDRSGPNQATTVFPLTRAEIERLAICGINESSLVPLQKILKWQFIKYNLLILTAVGWMAIPAIFPKIFKGGHRIVFFGMSLSFPFVFGISLAFLAIIGFTEPYFWPPLHRERMALNLMRLVRLLMDWNVRSETQIIVIRSYLERTRNQRVVERRMRQLAWSISRDIAIMCGQPGRRGALEPWACAGKAIVWCGDRMFDPRRRAMLWEVVPFLAEFVANEAPNRPPPLIVTAASQARVRPTKSIQLLYAGRVLRIPVVTGIIVAIASALLTWLAK